MKKLILLSTLLLSTINANTDFTTANFWESSDKQKHFAYTATIAGLGSAIARSQDLGKLPSWFIGFGSAIAIGILKEAVDGKGYGTEDIGDVYADFVGAGTGALVAVQWEMMF